MRSLVEFFRINGKPMFAPDEEVSLSFSDLDGNESGRDEGGYMHRIVIRYHVGTWSFSYQYITEEEMQYMESLFANAPDFEFTRPDRLDPGKLVTTRCYRSKYSIVWKNARTGQYRNYKFNIIEC